MTKIEEFVEFTQTLPAKDKADIESVLSQMMANYDAQLSPEQEAEDKRRHDDPNPTYATQEQVNAVWGKPLPV